MLNIKILKSDLYHCLIAKTEKDSKTVDGVNYSNKEEKLLEIITQFEDQEILLEKDEKSKTFPGKKEFTDFVKDPKSFVQEID